MIDFSVNQVQFMRNSRHTQRPVLEKCNRLLLLNVPQMSAEDISIITGLYQTLQFNNCDFRLASRQRLLELIDASTSPVVFTKLFATLGPMASQDSRERYGDRDGFGRRGFFESAFYLNTNRELRVGERDGSRNNYLSE